MANSCGNEVSVIGTEAEVRTFADEMNASDIPWNDSLDKDGVTPEDGVFRARFVFESKWKGPYDLTAEASARHPGVVVTHAAVELGQAYAEIRVYKAGEAVVEYEMQSEEIDELAGPDGGDEEPILDSLFATAHSYAVDALEAGASPKAG
jgi:hypothetical protein